MDEETDLNAYNHGTLRETKAAVVEQEEVAVGCCIGGGKRKKAKQSPPPRSSKFVSADNGPPEEFRTPKDDNVGLIMLSSSSFAAADGVAAPPSASTRSSQSATSVPPKSIDDAGDNNSSSTTTNNEKRELDKQNVPPVVGTGGIIANGPRLVAERPPIQQLSPATPPSPAMQTVGAGVDAVSNDSSPTPAMVPDALVSENALEVGETVGTPPVLVTPPAESASDDKPTAADDESCEKVKSARGKAYSELNDEQKAAVKLAMLKAATALGRQIVQGIGCVLLSEPEKVTDSLDAFPQSILSMDRQLGEIHTAPSDASSEKVSHKIEKLNEIVKGRLLKDRFPMMSDDIVSRTLLLDFTGKGNLFVVSFPSAREADGLDFALQLLLSKNKQRKILKSTLGGSEVSGSGSKLPQGTAQQSLLAAELNKFVPQRIPVA